MNMTTQTPALVRRDRPPRYAARLVGCCQFWLIVRCSSGSKICFSRTQNIERAGERKVWSRLARWEGRSIGAGHPTLGVLRPRQGHGTVLIFHHPSASREMQMTRLSPLCRGDKDLSCRFHNSSTVYIHHGRRLTQSCSEMMLFFPCVVSVIIASGAEREMSMNRMCACLLWCCLWRQEKRKKKYS